MLAFIKKIFNKDETIELPTSNSSNAVNCDDLSMYLKAEIDKADFIKEEYRNVVLSHLIGTQDLLKSGEKLSVAEKKDLGLNTRVSITREFVAVFNEKGLNSGDPKGIIQSIYYRATFKKSRTEDLQRIRKIGIKKIKLLSAGDDRDCAWCKSVDDKVFNSSQNIIDLIDKNCTCVSHCRCVIVAEIA